MTLRLSCVWGRGPWASLVLLALSAVLAIGAHAAQAHAAQAHAAQAQPENSAGKMLPDVPLNGGSLQRDPLRGIVINRTMTVLGWDFYTDFSAVWRSLYPDSEFTLNVAERPTAKYGSEIWVIYRDRPLFHTFLSPARSRVRGIAKQAVEAVHQGITQLEEQRRLYTDRDLAPEEF
ncbi:MAG TPA: curli production assembly/transport protein CsgE [Castellaniella sp.]|uniref:curli production assembly/transport protein CsgE n=1 Tax=Castellaniella sp. TaxID=1955812 RepID=UPI002F1559A5